MLFSQIGIDHKEGMYPIDKDGVSYQSSKKVRLNRNVFAIPKMLKLIGDIDNNIRKYFSFVVKNLKEHLFIFTLLLLSIKIELYI